MQRNELFEQSPLLPAIKMIPTLHTAMTQMNVSLTMHHMFNKQFSHVDEICDSDKLIEQRFNPNALSDQPAKKTLKVKSLQPITFGIDRKILLD